LFDLSVLPIVIEADQPQKTLPGLWVGVAPRRAARLRRQDCLAFFFNQTGSELLAPSLEQEMLVRLAESYFKADGSVTAAMRATVERLNEFLLNRNLRGARQGGSVIGALAMAVLHQSSLYVLLAGNAHIYLASAAGVEHFHDPAGRPLGQARVFSQRFFTGSLAERGLLLFSADAPVEWSETSLQAWAGVDTETLRLALVGQALNRKAAALRWQPGRGEVSWPAGTPGETIAATLPAAVAPRAVPAAGQRQQPVGVFLSGKRLGKGEASPAAETPPLAVPHPVVAPTPLPEARRARPAQPSDAARASTRPAPAPTPRASGPSAQTVAAAQAAADLLGGVRRGWNRLGAGLSRLAARAIPGQPAEGLALAPGTMLLISLAVPLMVVAVAATVYFQRGRNEQFQAYLRTAQQFSDQAAAQEDLDLKREDWNQALYWLDKAEPYGQSEAADELHQQAQASLDEMDGIQRVAYLPAGDSLPEGSQITRMVASITDVYMLDSTSGSVYRLYRTGQGYDLDLQFTCGPGKAGSTIIGPLLDIAVLPPNNDFKATVVGIDAGGNLEYCAPGVSGFSSTMLVPPDVHWGAISRMVLYQSTLYVMDPQVNAVYYFLGDKGSAFAGGPRLYFDAQVPEMSSVIDMAVDEETLYLLHEDGSMTTCSNAGFSTTCSDPAPYGDSRHGRDAEPLRFEDAQFIHLQSTQPPDPSLYVLDQEAQSVYQFSLRKLNLQRQYRPAIDAEYPLPERKATGFVITPNRRILLAVGNQAFYATLP
jgi:hypothetical protein